MEPERKPLEKPEPNLKPVEPEMPKGVPVDQTDGASADDPAKDKGSRTP